MENHEGRAEQAERWGLRAALVWALIQNWGGRVISFAAFWLLARLLSPDAFGLVALALIFIAFADIVVDQGFGDAIVRRREINRSFLATAFLVNISIGFVATAVTFQIAGSFAAFMGDVRLEPMVQALSFVFLLGSLSAVPNALLRREMNFRSLAFATTTSNLISGLIAVSFALASFGAWSLVIQQLAYASLFGIILVLAARFKPSFDPDIGYLRELFLFGSGVFGVRLLDVFTQKLGDGLIGYLYGAAELGAFSVGTRLALILTQLLVASMAGVYITHYSRLQFDNVKLAVSYEQSIWASCVACVPIFSLLALTSDTVVLILFGKEWQVAGPVLQAYSVQCALQVPVLFNVSLAYAVGRPHLVLIMVFAKLIVTGLVFVAIHKQGMLNVVWALSVCSSLFILPISFWIAWRLLKFRVVAVAKLVLVPVVCALVAGLTSVVVSSFFSLANYQMLCMQVIVFFAAYASLISIGDSKARVFMFCLVSRGKWLRET